MLSQSVLVHNCVCLSYLFVNLSLEQMGRWLHISDHSSIEQICKSLITAQILRGHIDQCSNSIHFEQQSSQSSTVAQLCNDLNDTTWRIAQLTTNAMSD